MSKTIIELPLSDVDEKTLKLYNEALDICNKHGYAYFDLSRLNEKIVKRSKDIKYRIYSDFVNNKIVKMP